MNFMNVNEIMGLSDWLNRYAQPVYKSYHMLATAMEQNANNGSKVPLREHLENLQRFLLSMPVEQLTFQQTDLLDRIGVLNLLGSKGWRFVERKVKEENYDPSSAATDIRKATGDIEKLISLFKVAYQAMIDIGLEGEPEFDSSNKVTVRVRFKDAVDISNVAQLKNRTADWYEISRGLAMAVGEKPEDVEVKGATTGSLIIILGTSLSVATMIALIMKQVAATVKSSMDIAHTLQDWKMRRIADAALERALDDRRKNIEANGASAAFGLVKEKLGEKLEGDVENALKKSIDKMFSFAAKGGEVDLLPPPQPQEDDEVGGADTETIKSIIANVEEMRTLKAATVFLIEDTGQEGKDEEMERPD
jgi:hypothetical protein